MVEAGQNAQSIPKTIHYCWFGKNPLGESELACIESWKQFLPDFEIKQWNEDNWNIECCDYVKEAFDAHKWAFVSDYARLDILYRFGGLYLDTDVELIRSMDDILDRGPYMGIEIDSKGTVNPGVGFAAYDKQPLLKEILDEYDGEHFLLPDGSFNTKTIVDRTTKVIKKHTAIETNGYWTAAGVYLYPSDYFNPKDYWTGRINLTVNTRSIHHFSMSWFSPRRKYKHTVCSRLMARGVPKRLSNYVAAVISILRFRSFD